MTKIALHNKMESKKNKETILDNNTKINGYIIPLFYFDNLKLWRMRENT